MFALERRVRTTRAESTKRFRVTLPERRELRLLKTHRRLFIP